MRLDFRVPGVMAPLVERIQSSRHSGTGSSLLLSGPRRSGKRWRTMWKETGAAGINGDEWRH